MSAQILLQLLNVRVLPPGRTLFALRTIWREVRALVAAAEEAAAAVEADATAEADDADASCADEAAAADEVAAVVEASSTEALAAVEERCQVAIANGKAALALLMRYQGDSQDTSTARGHTRLIDVMADRNLGGMYREADNAEESFDEAHPRGAAGRSFKRAAFPRGLAAITQLPFEEQLAMMEVIRDLCLGSQAANVATLHLEDWVERHIELTELYAENMAATKAELVTWAQVSDALQMLRVNVNQIVVLVMAAYLEATDEHEAARARLLAPLFAQIDAVSALRKRRRKVTDIDPTTGAELEQVDAAADELEPEPA